jgi:hypothetical protein
LEKGLNAAHTANISEDAGVLNAQMLLRQKKELITQKKAEEPDILKLAIKW